MEFTHKILGRTRKARTAVFHIEDDRLKGIEGETARRVGRSLLSEGDKVPDIFEVDSDRPFKIGDLYKYKGYDIFAVITGTLFITSDGVNIHVENGFDQERIICNRAREQRKSRIASKVCTSFHLPDKVGFQMGCR